MTPRIDPALAEAVDGVIREHHPVLAAGGYEDCSCGHAVDEKGELDRHLARLLLDTGVELSRPEFLTAMVHYLQEHTPPVYVGGVLDDRSVPILDGVLRALRDVREGAL